MKTANTILTNRTFASATMLAVAALAPAGVQAAGVSAGTLIENTAVATYDDGSATRTINSNTVRLRVDELIDVTLASLNSGPQLVTPGEAVLTFELTNQGNGPEAFRLIANPTMAGNGFAPSLRGIAIDSNTNGVYDPGVDEILADPQTTAIMTAGQRKIVFVLLDVPAGIGDGLASSVELTAQAVTGFGTAGTVMTGAGVDGGDAIVGMTGAFANAVGNLVSGVAEVTLVKSVAVRDPFGGTSVVPGAVASFTITANVAGTGTVAGLVVSDVIPAGTTYAPGTLALDGAALSDAADSDAGEASQNTGISVRLGAVATGQAHAVTFDVVIN